MKRSFTAFAFLAILSQVVPAATKVDSILTMTGGATTRCVWARWPWCDNSYAPVQAYKSTAYENDHNFTQVIGYSTEDGQYRVIDSTIGSHCFPHLTYRDGKYLIWSDKKNKCAWIRDFAMTAPARKLISTGDYFVLATQYNPATDSEFVYVMGGYDGQWVGTTIVRMPFKTDGTVDLTKKVTVVDGSASDGIDWHATVSQDGKYIGCMVPQPDAYMWLAGTTTKIGRHADGIADGGCQPNIAPDNSYRFFHLADDHMQIGMFGPGTTAGLTAWAVNIVNKLPGNPNGKNNANQPRWTNNVQLMTVGYPLETGLSQGKVFSMTAAQIQAADPSTAGSFCLAKFSADFKSIETAVRISDGDVRHREVVGDAWIKSSSVNVASSSHRGNRDAGPQVVRNGSSLTVGSGLDSRTLVSLTDAQGRLVRHASGQGIVSMDTRELNPGVYVLRSISSGKADVRTLTVHK